MIDLFFYVGVALFFIGLLMVFAPLGVGRETQLAVWVYRQGCWVLVAAVVSLVIFLSADVISRMAA